MADSEKIATVVVEWVAKAENDLKSAVYLLRAGKECPTDVGSAFSPMWVEGSGPGVVSLQASTGGSNLASTEDPQGS